MRFDDFVLVEQRLVGLDSADYILDLRVSPVPFHKSRTQKQHP